MKINRLPDLCGVGDTMDDFFHPDDCKNGEITIRKGHVIHSTHGQVLAILTYCPKPVHLKLVYLDPKTKEWEIDKGSLTDELLDPIIESVKEDLSFLVI